ncbi:MAG TPA: thiamine phosphate synthase [Candidatus Dormibacteraeota bacterium]|nr:thiamine phosphate synthase [Candidatus Dormibacteraeota bacterium]
MPLVFAKLYAIMDATLLKTSELACAEMLAQAGLELIQYRNKTATSRQYLETSRSLSALFHSHRIRFIVNDRADISVLAGADGVHVGQEDLGADCARAICGPQSWVGVSTHNLDQVRRAAASSADYIAIGPIFATNTKANPDPVVGTKLIRAARAMTAKPIVAIGGITLERTEEVLASGADSFAVAGDILCAPDPGQRAREYLQRIQQQKIRSARNPDSV